MTMSTLLYSAAFFAFAIGLTHSILGERYILSRLFRKGGLPKLFGGTEFTQATLRFAWHLTTIAWWGFSAILVLLANDMITFKSLTMVISITFLTSGIIALVASKGKHYAWLVFSFIGAVCLYVSIVLPMH